MREGDKGKEREKEIRERKGSQCLKKTGQTIPFIASQAYLAVAR